MLLQGVSASKVAAIWLAAGLLGSMAATIANAQPSAKQIEDRLLGHDQAPASPADCSTQDAIENNPECYQQVQGVKRGFSLVAPPTTRPSAPATGRTAPTAGAARHAVAAPRRTAASPSRVSQAASCGLRDSADARGVNLCVTFALNSATLTPQSKTSLDQLAQALVSAQVVSHAVRIEGYADASGLADPNQKLSEARAKSVVEYLVGRGVARDRLEPKGFGATNTLPGRDPRDPANRRVEARLKN